MLTNLNKPSSDQPRIEDEIPDGAQEWPYRYEYTAKDHLGNGRLYYSDIDNDGQLEPYDDTTTPDWKEAEFLQENHTYAFGLQLHGPWIQPEPIYNGGTPTNQENRYGYNGKELVEGGLGWLDYGFRWYDPSVGRFTGVDPITGYFPHATVYNYAENKPINSIDLWGLQDYEVNQDTKDIKVSANVYYNKNSSTGRRIGDNTYEGGSNLMELALGLFNNTSVEIDGEDWSVSYNIKFIGVDTNDEISDAISNDETGSSVGLVSTGDGTNFYSDASRTMAINSPRGDGTTIGHEFGHFLGLPHSAEIEGSPNFGSKLSEEQLASSKGIGPLMSYDDNRALMPYEVSYLAKHIVDTANGKNASLTNYYSTSFKGNFGLISQSQFKGYLNSGLSNQIQQSFKDLSIKK